MEVLNRYGTREQKDEWLKPLMDGEIRSAFLMTEPDVASSDATNIKCRIEMRGNEYAINGRKWWSSGAGDPRCKVAILMGKTDPSAETHKQQSMILVPLDMPPVSIKRHLPVFGYDDAPHGHMEIELNDVRVPPSSMLLGEGRGFEIAQDGLGARSHPSLHADHRRGRGGAGCDGQAADVPHRLRQDDRGAGRVGGAGRQRAHRYRDDAAAVPEGGGHDGPRREQGRAGRDRDDQGRGPNHGAENHRRRNPGFRRCGVSEDTGLARAYASIRTLRLADGPDEVHRRAIARLEFKKASMTEQLVDEEALGRWLSANVEGFQVPFDLTKFPSGHPTHLSHSRRFGRLRHAAEAVRQAAAFGPCR